MALNVCPSARQINEYLLGEIQGQPAEQLAEHIKACQNCLQATEQAGRILIQEESEAAKTGGEKAFASLSPLSDTTQTSSLSFLAPALGPDELGWLANYRVLKVLGEGGMGIVMLAEDDNLMRQVALKVMKPEVSCHPESRQRFMREAMAMAQVKSDHVVTIHQVGEHNDTCFIAMELLEGEPLDNLIESGQRPPVGEVLRIGREIAQALSSAHLKGLIHRDIKPENIWLESPRGRVKLLDFGLARPQEGGGKLTMTGMIMGTPYYMSPEQAQAEDIDERSDLFSLGCLLYLMVCGKRPFEAPTLMATLLAIVNHSPPEPDKYNLELPEGLNALIMRLMAKDRQQRYRSASEVVEQIIEIEKRIPANAVDWTAPLLPRGGQRASGTNAGTTPLSKIGTTSLSKIGTTPLRSALHHLDREAERRHVSVLVCSGILFDSDEYFELDVEDQTKILRAFQSTCRDIILRDGGTVMQGDEAYLLSCFGYPKACEEATVLAARSALSVLESLNIFSAQLHTEYGVELGARLGLHTGEAIVETKNNDISLVGDARQGGLRVMGFASSGQIVCSESTRRLLKNRFQFVDLGQQQVKGMKQAISLFQIKAANHKPAIVMPTADALHLVGRDLELNLLKDRWEQAQEGRGQVVLLGGEAGLGKSHLLQAIKNQVLADSESVDDSSIIEWHCSPHFRNTSLHPAINFLERLLHFERDEAQAIKHGRLVAFLDQYGLAQPDLVPVFSSLLNLEDSPMFPSRALTPAKEREELFRALSEMLSAYTEQRPLLFIIEDLHWVDDSTMQFLEMILEEVLAEQMLVVLSYRPEFRAPWTQHLQHTSITLSRLSRQQAAELVVKRAGRELPEPVLAQICERAGGVPLFIEEFTRMVQDSGLLEKSDLDSGELKALVVRAIPATLQELILARLDRLQGDLNIIQLVASIGRSVPYDLLSDVSGLDDTTLRAALSKLVKGEILIGKGRPPKATYSFKHVLLQDALYNALVKSKRRQFHERIAEALKARQEKTGDVVSEIVAHHLTEAGLIEQSIAHWLAAGLRSQEQFANVEAINHFKTGLELLAILPESEERDREELLLLSPLGSAYQATQGYSAPVVGPLFSRAKELCQKTGQPSQLFEILWGNWTWHLVQGDLSLCMDLANEMMAFATDTADSGMIMEAHVAPAVTLFYRGDFSGCFRYGKEAISRYENVEQCRIWETKTGQNSSVVLRCYLALALWHLGYPDRAQQLIEQMLTLARQCSPFTLGHALHFASWFFQYCRLGDKLLSSANEQITLACEQGFALWQASGTFLKGAGLVLQDRNDEGMLFMENGLSLFKAANAAITLAAQLGVLAEAYVKAGKFEEAQQLLAEGLSLADKHEDHYQEAELHRLSGVLKLAEKGYGAAEQAAAEESFSKALEIGRSQQSRAWQLRSYISLAQLRQVQKRHAEGKTALATIYDTYTEGLDMPDLLEARELIIRI